MTFHLIPCPHITSVSPQVACLAQEERTITITGTELVFGRSNPPRIGFGEPLLDVTSLDDCEDVPGTETMECSTLEFVAPTVRTAMLDTMDISITNLVDHTCCYHRPAQLIAAPVPRIFPPGTELDPDAFSTTVDLRGLFLTWETTRPMVHFGTESRMASSVYECEPVPGARENVNICNWLVVDVPSHLLEPGAEIPLSVSNPDPIGCTSEYDTWIHVSGGSP